MAEERPEGDRTEAATPRRLQRAREEGQVPISRELQSLAGLFAVTLVLMLYSGPTLRDLATRLTIFLARPHIAELDGPIGFGLAWTALLRAASPFVLAALLAGCAAALVQTGFLLNGSGLRPKAERISPIAGLRRLFGPESLIEAIKSLAKIGVMGLSTWLALHADLAALQLAPRRGLNDLLPATLRPVLHVVLVVLVVQAVVTILDVAWVRFRHVHRLRMSRHDLREEQKEMDGDPQIKARIKQIRTLRARRRMMAAVPKATVVVTNPTHYAVALAYDRTKNAAPRVVAKGLDTLAARIREVAAANNVPLVANPPLARALYRVELDREIPAEHYQAVAELIAYVWRLGHATRGAARAQ